MSATAQHLDTILAQTRQIKIKIDRMDGDFRQLYGRNSYKGEMRGNVPHGIGYMQWADGSRSYGQWVDGHMHGAGEMIMADGSLYSGEWVDGAPTGIGMMRYPDNSVYRGNWADGERCGTGELVYDDGRRISGEFHGDLLPGTPQMMPAGQPLTPPAQPTLAPEGGKARSLLRKFCMKTWRLWAALCCFAGVWLSILFVMWAINGAPRVKVGVFLIPIMIGWQGIKLLIAFFTHLGD